MSGAKAYVYGYAEDIIDDFDSYGVHDVALIYDHSMLYLYLNGIEMDATFFSGTLNNNTGTPLQIGRHTGSSGHIKYFDGKIYDVKIYDSVEPVTVEELLNVDAKTTINDFPDTAFKNNADNRKNALNNKIDAVLEIIAAAKAETDLVLQDELFNEAIDDLQGGILGKTDGCVKISVPDNNDWITDCAYQEQLYPIIMEAIDKLMDFI